MKPGSFFNSDRVLLALLTLGLVMLPFTASGYLLYVANLLLVYVILSLGMHLAIGEAGQFTLSHTAFFGIGIYTSGLVTNVWHAPFFVSIVAGAAMAAAAGLVIGLLALRVRDIYLALATFAFGEAMQWVLLNWEGVTNGANGLRMRPASIGEFQMVSDLHAYPFVVVIALLMLALTIALVRSRLGSAFRAVRESDMAAVAMGINARAVKVTSFVMSAAFAGVAGGTYTLFTSFIHPESLGFQTTVLVLTMVVVGGLGSVRGAVWGAIIVGLVAELLRQVPSYQEIIYGGILMMFMMFLPKGMASLFTGRGKGEQA